MSQRTQAEVISAPKPSRSSSSQQNDRVPATVNRTLLQPGAALPKDLAERAGRYFDFDFAQLRIHADAPAGESARDLGARAYAVHPHVVFAAGMYQPETPRGQALLLHELGHIRQQPKFTARAPLTVSASAVHEHNANQLGRGATRTAQPMPGNVVACSSTNQPAPEPPDYHDELNELISERHPALAKLKQGSFGDGVKYQVQKNGTYVVVFPPSPDGRLIIHDADDVRDIGKPSDGKLPPRATLTTGEVAVQRETKRLVAFNTAVTATYKPEDIAYNKDGKPIGIKNYKPTIVKASTGRDGMLVQNERNITTVGASADEGKSNQDVRLTKTIDKEKRITGDYQFTKQPGTEKDLRRQDNSRPLTFPKLEKATVNGRVLESTTAVVQDNNTGQTSTTRSTSDFNGLSIAARGKSADGPKDTIDPYVLDNDSIGEKTETSTRVHEYPLPSGRLMVVEQGEEKHAILTKGSKVLNNDGIEQEARNQIDNRNKEGLEDNFKVVKTTYFRQVPVDPKQKDGPQNLLRISSTTARSFIVAYGLNRVQTKEDTARRKWSKLPTATKSDDAQTAGVTLNASMVNEVGQGVAATNLAGGLEVGKKRNYKSASGPDVAAQGGKPYIGKTDLAAKQLYHDDHNEVNAAASDMGVEVSGASHFARGQTKAPPVDDEHATLFGVFCMTTIRSGVDLAGLAAEAHGTGQAERGGKGANLRAAQASLNLGGSFQLGLMTERAIEFQIKPDPAQIPWPAVRFITEAMDPIFTLKLSGNLFAGLEGKGELAGSLGHDKGSPTGVGASAFLGVRAGVDVEGSIRIARPMEPEPAADADPRKKDKSWGTKLGAVKGGISAMLGATAAWKSTTSLAGGRLVVGGEGALGFALGVQANLRAEIDAWKLVSGAANVARKAEPIVTEAAKYAIANPEKAASAALSYGKNKARTVGDQIAAIPGWLLRIADHGERERAMVQQRWHEEAELDDRVSLVIKLLHCLASDRNQQAILEVLRNAKMRGDLKRLVQWVGRDWLDYKLDGSYNEEYHELCGPDYKHL